MIDTCLSIHPQSGAPGKKMHTYIYEVTDHLCQRGYQNRNFHLPLREHGNKRENTYFIIGLNPS